MTRACLEVLAEFRNPVGIVTKNHLVTRDLDLLAELALTGGWVNCRSLRWTGTSRGCWSRVPPRRSGGSTRSAALAEAGMPAALSSAP